MIEREKIIETLKHTSDIWKEEERHGYIVSVDLEKIADALIENGYRKQSDTVKEFVCKVLQIGSKRPLCLFNEYKEGYTDCLDQIKELAAQYGVEVEE